MIYNDRVYGKMEISEPVVLELIGTPAMQRLKGVGQFGYKHMGLSASLYSRLEHSIGVYLLLRKYSASLPEQVAGLIHDVSHGVFSHCLDYALDEGSEKEQNHQDNILKSFIKKTRIPAILKKYGLNTDDILNDKKFLLKEKSLPDLCADRIDYCLRDGLVFKEIEPRNAKYLLNGLFIGGNEWIFKDLSSAEKFSRLFLKLNRVYYAGIASARMFRTAGDCLKYALKKKYIIKKDLFTTDSEVLKKLKSHLEQDQILKLLFQRMDGQIKIRNNPKNYDARVFCKSRIVDPLCEYRGKIKRISEIDKKWAQVVERELKPKEYFLKFSQ